MILLETENIGIEAFKEEGGHTILELRALDSDVVVRQAAGTSLGDALQILGTLCLAEGIDFE